MYSATITFEIDCTVISNKYGFKIEKMTPKFITGDNFINYVHKCAEDDV